MKNGKYLVAASLIFSLGLVIAANLIATEINHTGVMNTSSTHTVSEHPSANYELIVHEGWFYLYDTLTGQIWKKPDNDDRSTLWEMVEHFSK